MLTALARYHWPGNVRELQNVMAGVAVSAPARGQVKAGLLPPVVTRSARRPRPHGWPMRAISSSGASSSWRWRAPVDDVARAARELGLSRQGLLKMMTRLGMTG